MTFRWVVKTVLNFYISVIEFVLSRLVSVLPARLRMPLKELFLVWVLYFAILVCEGWLWNLNKKGCFLTLTSKAVIPVILETWHPWGTETVNKLLCSVWHVLSTLLTFFPLCKAVGSLSSVPALLQFFSVVSLFIYRVPLVSSNLVKITEPRSFCRPKSWRSVIHLPILWLVLNLLIRAASVYLLLNFIPGY